MPLPCHVALVLPTKQDYKAATLFLDKILLRHTLASSGAECTLGIVGPHTVVLATGPSHTTTSHSVDTAIDDLLVEYPSVRAGLLVGTDARAPSEGPAQAGDIIVGLPRSLAPGLIQFEPRETRLQQRLSATTHLTRPPGTVRVAVIDMMSPPVSHALSEYLERGINALSPTTTRSSHEKFTSSNVKAATRRQPRILRGKIASSDQRLQDSNLIQKQGTENQILCFETAAAHLKSHLPFLVICGVIATAPASSPDCAHGSTAAFLYAMFLIRHLNAAKLANEHAFSSLFRHKPFDLDRLGFRLLQVHRGTSLPIKCQIFQAYLDDPATIVPYDALSYVWGSTDVMDIVIMNGRVMPVTASLHDALHHLRHEDQDRILWVDALCIDQTQTRERGHQVKCMGDIYEKAERVTIWLGFVNEEAGLLWSALKELERQAPIGAFRTWSHDDPRWKKCWIKVRSTNPLGVKFNRLLLIGLQSVLEKPWFKRVWILQEVAKAQRAVVHCSRGSINARSFALAPLLLGEVPEEQVQAVLDIMPGPSRQSSWWSERRNLGTLLWKFRGCHATDPRDRVYALLGIASDITGDEIQADYSKNEEEVLCETCHYLFADDVTAGALAVRTISNLQARLPRLSARALKLKLDSQTWNISLERFIDRQGNIDPTDRIFLDDVVRFGEVNIHLLFSRFDPPFPTSQYVEEATVRKAVEIGPNTLQFLLRKSNRQAVISGETVLEAIKAGFEILQLLFRQANTEIYISEEAVLGAIQAGPTILQLLLQQLRTQIEVFEATVLEAIDAGSSTLRLLLQHRRVRFEVTENMTRAVKHMENSADYMALLRERWREDNESEILGGWTPAFLS
ncbi:hypothetical protein FDECE_14412 [Fusarium decemcellulare]|nr:hypothetical protein FDECE_14412 [Fusarium decemcellulare]